MSQVAISTAAQWQKLFEPLSVRERSLELGIRRECLAEVNLILQQEELLVIVL